MDLYLLRHAIAVDRDHPSVTSDFDRALTREGRKKMEKIAAGMQRLGVSVEHVVTSPAARARETAEIAARALGSPPLVELDTLYRGDSHAIRRAILELPRSRSLLVVGHEPTLSELASLWICGDPGLGIDLKKAGLILLDVTSRREEERAMLRWLMPPKALESLGEQSVASDR
ncbi:MAG: phosphohistidine phosphatase SixA [Planctomycetes bacterium]|nr:phosphohistidine phosphatase SixA [Planctomycetota bacterium]